MSNGSGVSRGDRNRNARLARLRALVPVDERDRRDRSGGQEADGRGDRSRLEGVGAARRSDAGPGISVRRWTGLPSGPRRRASPASRWRVSRPGTGGGCWASWPPTGMPFVCVQPMMTSWARRSEDLTHRQDRREGRGADRPADRAAALLHTRTGR